MDISARICTRLSQWSPVILRVSYIKVLVPLSCRPQVSVTLIWNFSDHSTPPLRTFPPTLVPTQQCYLGTLPKMSSHPRQKRGKKWNEIKSKHWEADLDVCGCMEGTGANGWTDEQMNRWKRAGLSRDCQDVEHVADAAVWSDSRWEALEATPVTRWLLIEKE